MSYIRVPDPNNPNWTNEDWGGPEHIQIDVENPEEFEISEVNWGIGYKQINYNVRVEIVPRNAEITEVHTQYLEQDNQHLIDAYPREAEDIIWGTHVLILTAGENYGPSLWNGEEGPGWTRQRRRVTTTRLQRAQAVFRAMLLARDHGCAVTGEVCHDVLEAAHIVPVQHGGQEVLSNGILLRSDVHRLFDAIPPRFQISPEIGEVLVNDFHYEGFDLHGIQIDEELLGRIRNALLWRQENGL